MRAAEFDSVPSRRRIAILYTDAGYGHVATANVIRRQIEATYGWEVTLIDPYRGMLASVDPYLKIFRKSGPDIYNELVLRRGHTTVFWPCFAALSQFLCFAGLALAAERLATIWGDDEFDLVLSVMPLIIKLLQIVLEGVEGIFRLLR